MPRLVDTQIRCPVAAMVTAGCVLALVLAGCASRPTRAPSQSTRNAAGNRVKLVAPATTPETIKAVTQQNDSAVLPNLPISDLQISPARQALLQNARAVAESSCMAKLNVRYRGLVVTAGLGEDARARRYGVGDLTMAQKYGYHLPGKDAGAAAGQAAVEPKSDFARSTMILLDGTTRTAPNGATVPADGCTGQARRDLAEPSTPQQQDIMANGRAAGVVSRIDASSYVATKSSPGLAPILVSWSACMALRGYHFASPIAALDSVDLRPPVPSKGEIRQAIADVHCKSQTKLVSRWAALEAPLQRSAMERSHSELAEYAARLHAELSAASKVLDLSEIPA